MQIQVLTENKELLPVYGTEDAAGADVRANIEDPLILEPGSSCLVPTGLFLEIPRGYEVQVRPRSGLALKHQVTVLNTPGTIDSDYRGEVGVILINHGKKSFVIEPKMRIAQFVVMPVLQGEFVRAQELAASCRGSGGFGHTGVA